MFDSNAAAITILHCCMEEAEKKNPLMHLICLQWQTDLNINANRQLIKVRASLGLIPCRVVETEAAVVF